MSDETTSGTSETGPGTGGGASGGPGGTGGTGAADGDDAPRSTRERVSDGFQRGIGVLSAFKDALEETIAEARERGDLSTDRAREVFKGAVGKAREATSEARERFDFVHQQDFDALARRVSELERQVRDRIGSEPPGGGGTGTG